MKYRKKPVVIEAVEWNSTDARRDEISALAGFDVLHEPGGNLLIPTLEGVMSASPGDMIIKGVKGEVYPCKPDIFAQTYDPAE